MAIFYSRTTIITRGQGKSAVAAAAYRSGSKLTNDYTGLEHNYTKKGNVEYSEIMLPPNAPSEYASRSFLWNAVESAEKAKNSQLARELTIALPIELSTEDWISLCRDYCQENFVSEGMCVDFSIHNPPMKDDLGRPIDKNGDPVNDPSKMLFNNPHVHIMLTMRPIDENGKWLPKLQLEYLCIKDGEEKAFTAEEFKAAKENGWEKQYKYYGPGNKKIYLPPSKSAGFTRINKTPKTTKNGRQNPKIAEWNSTEIINKWRKRWAELCNQALEKRGSDIRIDHRSYADRGEKDFIPKLHQGPAVTQMERKAKRMEREGKYASHPEIILLNQMIEEHNRSVRKLRAEYKTLLQKETGIRLKIRQIEGIRAQLVTSYYEGCIFEEQLQNIENKLFPLKSKLEKYQREKSEIETRNSETREQIANFEKQIHDCGPLEGKKKRSLRNEVSLLQEYLTKNESRLDQLTEAFTEFSQKYPDISTEIHTHQKEYDQICSLRASLAEERDKLNEHYQQIFEDIKNIDFSEFESCQQEIRREYEKKVRKDLQRQHGKISVPDLDWAVKHAESDLKTYTGMLRLMIQLEMEVNNRSR